METTGPGRHEAETGLSVIAQAHRAVRGRRWPLWLYPTNALLLGGIALTGLIGSSAPAALLVLALASLLAFVNDRAGRAIGTPYAIPASRGFRALAALSGALAVASVLAPAGTPGWLVPAGAAAAVVAYGVGAVVHHRSTHR